jgi:hypothetical protein
MTRLYLSGFEWLFARNQLGLHQVLAQLPTAAPVTPSLR